MGYWEVPKFGKDSGSLSEYLGSGGASGSSRGYGWLGFSHLSVNVVLMQHTFIKFFQIVDNTVLEINSTTVSEC
jgi:hypothetical protein